MGIQVKWDNKQKNILVCTFEENWTWREYDAAMELGREMIDSVSHPVDVIFDVQRTLFAPSGALRNLGKSFRGLTDANLNHLVIVGATGIFQIIVDVLHNLYPRAATSMVHAATLTEAYKLLGQSVGAGS